MTQPREDKAESLRYYMRIIAPGLLATAEREYRFDPERKYLFDWAWPAAMLAVEIDGGQFAYRGGRHATDGDREKLNHALAFGWRVLRFSPQMLEADPDDCIAQIQAALAAAGGTE